jgi:hypothetical protein
MRHCSAQHFPPPHSRLTLREAAQDTVESAIAWTLSSEVERLVLTGPVSQRHGQRIGQPAGRQRGANVLDGKAGVGHAARRPAATTRCRTRTAPARPETRRSTAARAIDTLKGTAGADLLAGGRGDDVLTLGGGTDVVCFNRGDGVDTINAPVAGAGAGERNDTLSLGGVGFGQMQLSRDASDLLVKIGSSTDLLRVKSWYLGSANQTIGRLQVVVDTTSDFAPGTGDVLRTSRLCVLDLVSLVNAFDAARAANPTLVNWTPTDTQFAAARLGSSDSAAIGGTLAYRYSTEGTLAQVGYSTAVADLSSSGFGSAAQTVSAVATAGAQTMAADRRRRKRAASHRKTTPSRHRSAAPNRCIGGARVLRLVRITADDEAPWSAKPTTATDFSRRFTGRRLGRASSLRVEDERRRVGSGSRPAQPNGSCLTRGARDCAVEAHRPSRRCRWKSTRRTRRRSSTRSCRRGSGRHAGRRTSRSQPSIEPRSPSRSRLLRMLPMPKHHHRSPAR